MSLDELKPYVDPRWHFDLAVGVSPGWEKLVLDTHERLVVIDPTYQIVQIKEKFGGLRYYVGQTTQEPEKWNRFREIIVAAETDSYKICEQCGTREPEDHVTTAVLGEGFAWILTLCDRCRATRFAERVTKNAEYEAELVAKYGPLEDDEDDES